MSYSNKKNTLIKRSTGPSTIKKRGTKILPKGKYTSKGPSTSKSLGKRKYSSGSRGWLVFGKLVKYAFVLAIWGITICIAIFLYFAHDLPDVSKLGTIQKIRKVTLINMQGEILSNFGDLYGNYVSYDEVPKELIMAVIATEDRRFFDHHGIDPLGLARAFYENYKAGRVVQGGSTITQQLAKIVFLSPERTMKRKFQELILSFYLERTLDKHQIMTEYLNRVYLGSGIYGVDAAAKYYFGKNVGKLTLLECAIITGLLKAPTRYSPINNTERSGQRAYQILLNMRNAGYITEKDIEETSAQTVMIQGASFGTYKNSYFASWVLDQVNLMIPDDGNDLIVKTTIDERLQEIAEKSMNHLLEIEGSKQNVSQGAVVVMSKDGKVLAMVGGKNYGESPFNRATQAKRQPGSAFKHVVYLAAFENGVRPNEIVFDGPIRINKWVPRNISRKYYGDISVRSAFARSINTVAVKLAERVGRQKVIETAKRLGIHSEIAPHPSLTLGSADMTLLELTGSYATIANDGYQTDPYGIEEVFTDEGNLLFKKSKKAQKVSNNKAIGYIKEVLLDTVNHGSGVRAKIPGFEVYGKTGTSQEHRNAWFIGFVEDYVTGVWVGNDDNSPTKKAVGSRLPAHIWKDINTQALKGRSL